MKKRREKKIMKPRRAVRKCTGGAKLAAAMRERAKANRLAEFMRKEPVILELK